MSSHAHTNFIVMELWIQDRMQTSHRNYQRSKYEMTENSRMMLELILDFAVLAAVTMKSSLRHEYRFCL